MDRIEKIKEYLSITPDDSFLQHALALEYVKLGDDKEARKLFESLLHHDENYVGSYYHLGKLLERNGETNAAINCYEKGMGIATKLGDKHAHNELRSAYEDIVD